MGGLFMPITTTRDTADRVDVCELGERRAVATSQAATRERLAGPVARVTFLL